MSLTAEVPATILKGVGIDLFSIGQFAAGEGDTTIVAEERDPYDPSYRKLVISGGRAVGATVVGNDPEVVAAATAAVKNRAELTPQVLADLRRGEWTALRDAGRLVNRA
jgi:NAD(P)H-nitrite reductase large subunit